MSLPHTPSEQKASITRIKENGIQIIKEHRNELPADTHDGDSLRRAVRVGHGLRAVEFVQLCREAAGENLRAGQRQVAHPRALILALSQDLSQNRPVEAREHVRRFHELFFTLSPDKAAIEGNIRRALYLCDESAFRYYKDWEEKGYYNRIISANINQTVRVDSVACDFERYPYIVTTYARQSLVRSSNITERSLVTRCRLLNSVRSDNNPHGFTMEQFTILENRDLRTIER